ncbi:hypothetical protein EDE12_11559 [Methylosinus sp. sav-2]|nr:hypothetical protein EDE12_11559 [Methylosinus sp. sav-2]
MKKVINTAMTVEYSRSSNARQRLARDPRSVLLAVLFTSWNSVASASDTEMRAEMEALKAQVRRLEHRLESQTKDRKGTNREVERVTKSDASSAKSDALWPDVFHYKNVTLKPGGFFEFGAVHRDRFMGADLATPFGNIPYANNPTSHDGETRFTARRSRFTLQTDANLDDETHARLYFAADFLSAAQTANLTQSDSFNLRFRELYTSLDRSDYGLHVSAGQMYSLASLNSRGTTPDAFLVPPVIDDQYLPGYTWSRQPGVRISKDLPYDLQIAVGAEAAYTNFAAPGMNFTGTVAPIPANGVSQTLPGTYYPGAYSQNPIGGSLYNSLNAVTFNHVPDLMTKASWDPTLFDRKIHIEGGGMLRNLNDRTFGGNHDVWAGSGFIGVTVPVIPKLVDFQLSGITGRANGRYGSASIADATFDWTGAPQPIHERQLLVGVTVHPTPKTDVYAFAGGEFAGAQYSTVSLPKTAYLAGGVYSFGYGNPGFVNSGCSVEGSYTGGPYGLIGSCVGQTKSLRQLTGGVWHNFYDGPGGKVRVGAQYSYTIKDSFIGVGGAPKATENMIFLSLRYMPFN